MSLSIFKHILGKPHPPEKVNGVFKKHKVVLRMEKTWAEIAATPPSSTDFDRPLPAPPQPVQPWSTKMNYLFATLPGHVRRQLKWDEVALYSVMKSTDADTVTKIMLEHIEKIKPNQTSFTIVDGTACVGGNTISFAAGFEHVIAVELNEERAAMLRFNVEIAGFADRVAIICDDFLNLDIGSIKPDAVFLDPPWGGPDYKNYTELDLYLNDQNIVDVIDKLVKTNENCIVGIRLPFNYNFARLGAAGLHVEYVSIGKFTLALVRAATT